jgi:hypothetical protein
MLWDPAKLLQGLGGYLTAGARGERSLPNDPKLQALITSVADALSSANLAVSPEIVLVRATEIASFVLDCLKQGRTWSTDAVEVAERLLPLKEPASAVAQIMLEAITQMGSNDEAA